MQYTTSFLAEVLAEAIEKKDRGTGGHVKRTAHYAVRIARELDGLTEAQIERVRLAAILHDVGKIGVADRILTKDSSLEPDEWSLMRQHPQLGFEIVSRMQGFEDVAQGVIYHHERWDGRGYPDGLSGERIPWIARLIAVADAYDAMVSNRPYRKGISAESAYDEMMGLSGSQFDPRMVEAFLKAFAKRGARSAGAASASPTLSPEPTP